MADTAAPAPTRALVLGNPASGSHSPELVEQVRQLCASCLEHTEVHLTTGPGDATAAVRRALGRLCRAAPGAPDLIVVIGGDGTVREAVQGLVPATGNAALAVVPGGTGNSGYKMLWGERPWSESLKAILTDTGVGGSVRLRRLDLARLAETRNYVYLGACSGVIADALLTAGELPLKGRERYARAYADTAARLPAVPGPRDGRRPGGARGPYGPRQRRRGPLPRRPVPGAARLAAGRRTAGRVCHRRRRPGGPGPRTDPGRRPHGPSGDRLRPRAHDHRRAHRRPPPPAGARRRVPARHRQRGHLRGAPRSPPGVGAGRLLNHLSEYRS
ncbi:acylglycerol kinase family protein [Streptomyces lasalocidi]